MAAAIIVVTEALRAGRNQFSSEPMDNYDSEYRDRVALAAYEAVVNVSMDDDGDSIVKVGPAFDGLMMVAALLIAGSPQVSSPSKLRQFCEREIKKLRKQISAAQSDPNWVSTLKAGTAEPTH